MDSGNARLVFLNGVWQAKLFAVGSVPSCISWAIWSPLYADAWRTNVPCRATVKNGFCNRQIRAEGNIDEVLPSTSAKTGGFRFLENHLASGVRRPSKPTHASPPRDSSCMARSWAAEPISRQIKFAQQRVVITAISRFLRGGSPARNEIDVLLEGEEHRLASTGLCFCTVRNTQTHYAHHASGAQMPRVARY